VLTDGSVSQSHGLRSIRVGWLTGPRHLVKACALTAALSGPYVPAVCQRAAVRVLEAGDDAFGRVREQFRDRGRYVLDRLRGMGLEPSSPAGGFFVWVPVSPPGPDGRTFADGLLKEHGVRVGPGSVFGPSGGGHVRISFAAEDGRLREGLSRLAKYVATLRGEPAEQAAADEPEPVGERSPSFSRV
jgi:aspartate/methionine/tyrosine aminotransferase